MTTDHQVNGPQEHKRFPWLRFTIVLIAFLFLVAAAIIWINHADWSPVLTIIFAVLGVVLALLAWLFPFSPSEPKAPKDIDVAHGSTLPPINITVSPNISPNINVSPNQNMSVQSLPAQANASQSVVDTLLHGLSVPNRSNESSVADIDRTMVKVKQSIKKEEIQSLPDPNTVFQFNVSLTHTHEFYGRARERVALINRTTKGESTSIVGPRRIGKTWLISYLMLEPLTNSNVNLRIGYLDATRQSCATVPEFTASVLDELGVLTLDTNRANLGLAALERAIKDLKSKNQISILCIDEFEGFDNRNEFDLNFYIGLRAIAQMGLGLVIASKNPLIDIVGDYGKTSGFFNVFEQHVLKPFNLEEAEKFAQAKSIQAGFTDQERIYLLRYGQNDEQLWPPLRLQLVGKMLLEDKNLAVTEGSHYYRPNDLNYWRDFERRLEEKYQGVVR
jgi:hypothetical protein